MGKTNIIIGVSGHIGSGKSTFAEMLIAYGKESGIIFEHKFFGDKLKQIVAIIAGVEKENCYTQEGKNLYIESFGMTLGEMQQQVGNGLRDGVDNDLWVKALFSDYKFIRHEIDTCSLGSKRSILEFPNWIVSDVRFPNEAEAIKERGGIIIRLEGDPAKIRHNSKRDLNHSSETSLDQYEGFDYIYHNNKSILDLKDFAKEIINNLN